MWGCIRFDQFGADFACCTDSNGNPPAQMCPTCTREGALLLSCSVDACAQFTRTLGASPNAFAIGDPKDGFVDRAL